MARLESSVKPYRDKLPAFTEIPEAGRDRAEILRDMQTMYAQEEAHWKDGFVSGAGIVFIVAAVVLLARSDFPGTVKVYAYVIVVAARLRGWGYSVLVGASAAAMALLIVVHTFPEPLVRAP